MKLHKLIPITGNPHTKIVLLLACLISLTIIFASAGSATASAGLQTEATTDLPGNDKPQQQQAMPAITLTATPFVYVSGVGTLIFNLSREGDTTDSLDVTVNLTQEHGWLADTNHTATFAAGASTISLSFPGGEFSSSVTQSGDLTATVATVDGYDVTGASATVRVISQPGISVAVIIEHPTYTVAEDAGTLDIVLVARARTGITSVDAFSVAVSTDAQTALAGLLSGDYQPVLEHLGFASSDFQVENGALVARKTISVTIHDDESYESDEYFHLHLGRVLGTLSAVALFDTEGELCTTECSNPYVVTITDDQPAVTVSFGQAAYSVVEGNSQGITVTLSDDPQRTVIIPITTTGQDGATGDDFSGVPDTITFNATETSKTFTFSATDDAIVDRSESVLLSFGSDLPAGVSAATPNQSVVSITDNDPAVTVSFGQAAYSVVEGNSQGITVTLSDDPQRTVVIPITVDEQDGAAGDDYSGVPMSVTFNTGETSRTIPFAATYDTIDDDGESVALCFCTTLPPGVTEGANKEAVVTITERELTAPTEQPGISVPRCESNGISIFWHAGIAFDDQPPPYGWRVERRHFSDGEWITSRFDFLGATSDALQTYSDEYWDWTDATRRRGVDYTYRVHALDNSGELLEGRNWSRRAPEFCQ